jgi:serpin B
MRLFSFGFAAIGGFVLGCSPAPAVCSAPQGSSSEATALAGAWSDFAVDLSGPMLGASGRDQNAIFSPFSVASTLTMVDAGARGTTADQIEAVLHFAKGGADASSYAALSCAVESDGSAGDGTLAVANALFGQKGKTFESTFLTKLSDDFAAPLQRVDFEKDASAAITTIDGWVSDQTAGNIPKLVDASDVDKQTRLVVVDAVYFKGTWEKGFDPAKTTDRQFSLATGARISVPTMDGKVELRAGGDARAQVIELAYQGGEIAMDLFVPTASLADFEGALDADGLRHELATLGERRVVELQLPKFSFATHVELAPVLAKMGMVDAFDPNAADLSGMDGAHDLFLGAVVHQATIEVDESGTVATAATSGSVEANSVEEPIVVDRPFLFSIRDTKTGAILFLGHVADPRPQG